MLPTYVHNNPFFFFFCSDRRQTDFENDCSDDCLSRLDGFYEPTTVARKWSENLARLIFFDFFFFLGSRSYRSLTFHHAYTTRRRCPHSHLRGRYLKLHTMGMQNTSTNYPIDECVLIPRVTILSTYTICEHSRTFILPNLLQFVQTNW